LPSLATSSAGHVQKQLLIQNLNNVQYVMRKQWFCVSAGTPDFTCGEKSIAAFLLMLQETEYLNNPVLVNIKEM